MSELVANLFLYLEDNVIKKLGAVAHNLDGDENQKIAFLQNQVVTDASQAIRYPLPVDFIKSWLGVDATNGMSLELYSYLGRTGNALHLFEDIFRAIRAPAKPLVCITPIIDGKPQINVLRHVDPIACPVMSSEEFGGIVKQADYLAAYITPAGLNVHDLLGDDFTDAIKLLYQHKHYVSAMKLLVSFVDTVAYLDIGDVGGNYEKWLSKYAALTNVGLTPSELWEFRNAILHMTNPFSRRVLSGKVLSLNFYIDPASKRVRIDKESGAKIISFLSLYEAIIEAVDKWTKSYSGDLAKQLEFIKRYDTVMSEGRIAKFRPNAG
jgi:hypothetical protein